MKTAPILYAPPSYIAASAEVRARVCNGCGTKGWKGKLVPDTIYGLKISEACNIHDWMYAQGSTLADKDEADRVFLNNILRIIAAEGGINALQWLRRRRAHTYYESVARFGGPAFWDGKNEQDCLLTLPLISPA